MKSPRKKSFILCGVVLMLMGTAAFGKTLYIEKWGNNANPCTKTLPCLNIQTTLDNRGNKNDTLKIGPGVYDSFLIDAFIGDRSGVKLESTHGRYATVIESTGGDAVFIDQPKVRIGKPKKGFTIRGATVADRGGIFLASTASGAKIEGNRFVLNFNGIRVAGAEKVQIRSNIVEDSDDVGIVCDFATAGCPMALFQSNTVIDNDGGGISVGAGEKVSVLANVARDNGGKGIALGTATSLGKVKDNVVSSNASDGLEFTNIDGSLVQGNISFGNGNTGIALIQNTDTGSDPQIKSNLTMQNAVGIYVQNGVDVKLEKNSASSLIASAIIADNTTFKSFKNNNTIDSGGAGNCHLENLSVSLLEFSKHFFGLPVPTLPDTDFACGTNPPTGTIVSKPNVTAVSKAQAL